jgi:hypothetical protein
VQTNHIYVDDDKKGTVSVYDDNNRIDERKFTYSGIGERAAARTKAEGHAARTAARLRCNWGCNYQGHKV